MEYHEFLREIAVSWEILSTNGNFLSWIYSVHSRSNVLSFRYRGNNGLGTKIYVDSTTQEIPASFLPRSGFSRNFFCREFPGFFMQYFSVIHLVTQFHLVVIYFQDVYPCVTTRCNQTKSCPPEYGVFRGNIRIFLPISGDFVYEFFC